MQTEERNMGAVSNNVYNAYIKAGKGYLIVPMLILSPTLLQVVQVMSSYWCVRAALSIGCLSADGEIEERKWNRSSRFHVRAHSVSQVVMLLTFRCRWASTLHSVSRKPSRSS